MLVVAVLERFTKLDVLGQEVLAVFLETAHGDGHIMVLIEESYGTQAFLGSVIFQVDGALLRKVRPEEEVFRLSRFLGVQLNQLRVQTEFCTGGGLVCRSMD